MLTRKTIERLALQCELGFLSDADLRFARLIEARVLERLARSPGMERLLHLKGTYERAANKCRAAAKEGR